MTATSKSERIALRIAAEDKARLERAAALRGTSLSEFVLASSREAAEGVIGDQTHFILNRKQMVAFHAALDSAPREIPQLKRLFAKRSVLEK
jgi:uncharacterized protein (DUF1778 family)